ncbi:hypothetical protein DPMN_158862 [Dreissena polymorpha]|uniref:Uncharacterized protein n=1 Tax=Dreissena polymorpha TaxID=45954 RepID=A0A9D4EN93_DREPO|nr:hypothetical protein DPMN_158862 [Dreissena polymorpha]
MSPDFTTRPSTLTSITEGRLRPGADYHCPARPGSAVFGLIQRNIQAGNSRYNPPKSTAPEDIPSITLLCQPFFQNKRYITFDKTNRRHRGTLKLVILVTTYQSQLHRKINKWYIIFDKLNRNYRGILKLVIPVTIHQSQLNRKIAQQTTDTGDIQAGHSRYNPPKSTEPEDSVHAVYPR